MKRQQLAAFLVMATVSAFGVAHATEAEIERLLQFVGTSGCGFERNGNLHPSDEAEAHLRRKLAGAKGRVKDADTFIDRVASESSWTGKPYRVTCADQELLARDWLVAELQRIRDTSE